MKEMLTLHFDQAHPLRLESTVLEVVASDGSIRRRKAWREAEAHPREASFRWAKGLMTLSLVLLRIKVGELDEDRRPLLSGMTRSAAATLDNMVHKADGMAWLRDMLSVTGEEGARLRLLRWFHRKNSQGNNRDLPIRIFARTGAGALLGENIHIHLAGQPASEQQLLEMEGNLALILHEEPWQENLAHKKTEDRHAQPSLPNWTSQAAQWMIGVALYGFLL